MTHPDFGERYEMYSLGLAEPEEKAELERHIAEDCPQCREGMRQALTLGAFMASLPERVEPSKRLRARVLASIGVEPPGRRLWLGALGFACAGLAIALLLVTHDGNRWKDQLSASQAELRRTQTDLLQARAVLDFLNAPGTKEVGFGGERPQPPHGRVLVNAGRGVLLLASNLPQAPAGKIYEMWLIPKTGAPIPAGLFQSDKQGNALYLRNERVDLANTKAVAVTLEPEAGSAAPTSTPLIAAGLSD